MTAVQEPWLWAPVRLLNLGPYRMKVQSISHIKQMSKVRYKTVGKDSLISTNVKRSLILDKTTS